MPREKINYAAPFESRAAGDSSPAIHGESWPEPEVHISWSRGGDYGPGHVQVAIDLPRDYVKHLAEQLDHDNNAKSVMAFSPALTRPHLNRLVQMTRRARDQAYGRDE